MLQNARFIIITLLENEVVIYTDGGCSGNPGPGGWGAILRYGGHTKELSGGYRLTTNNRMEIMAVLKALSAAKEAKNAEYALRDYKNALDEANTLGGMDNKLSMAFDAGDITGMEEQLRDPGLSTIST